MRAARAQAATLKPALFTPLPKSCSATCSTTRHLKIFSLSAAGQPPHADPGTLMFLPTAAATFLSKGFSTPPASFAVILGCIVGCFAFLLLPPAAIASEPACASASAVNTLWPSCPPK